MARVVPRVGNGPQCHPVPATALALDHAARRRRTDSDFLKLALSCCHEKAPRRDAPLFHDCLPLIGLGESDSAPTASGRRSARRKLTAGQSDPRAHPLSWYASGQINVRCDWAELSPARLVHGSSMPCNSSRCTPYARHCYRTHVRAHSTIGTVSEA